jgi:hypothetical protein
LPARSSSTTSMASETRAALSFSEGRSAWAPCAAAEAGAGAGASKIEEEEVAAGTTTSFRRHPHNAGPKGQPGPPPLLPMLLLLLQKRKLPCCPRTHPLLLLLRCRPE